MVETQQLIMDVMAPGGFGPDGSAIATALRVRLMHAAVRYLVKQHAEADPSAWRSEWGEPINQEDLVTTLMGFSVLIFDALSTLGVRISQDDQEGYFHLWLLAGHFLGVNPEVLPNSVAEGRELFATERRRYYRATEQGLALEGALLDTLAAMAPPGMEDLPVQFIRLFIGDNYADLLHVPGSRNWRRRVFRRFMGLHSLGMWFAGTSGLAAAAAPLTRELLFALSQLDNGGQRPPLRRAKRKVRTYFD